MRLIRSFVLVGVLLSSFGNSFASHGRRGPTASRHTTARQAGSRKVAAGRGSSKRSSTKRGRAVAAVERPRGMDDSRATQIQSALVKAGYLQEVTGHWDSSSQAAMQKLQGDNGWQTKMIPDSRALIKLGLGPSATVSKPAVPSNTGSSEDVTTAN